MYYQEGLANRGEGWQSQRLGRELGNGKSVEVLAGPPVKSYIKFSSPTDRVHRLAGEEGTVPVSVARNSSPRRSASYVQEVDLID